MPRKQLNEQYYTPAQVKEILGITDNMLYYHVRNGTLQRITPPGRKQGVYLREEVDKLAKDMQVFFATRKVELDSKFSRATKEDIPELVELSRAIFGGHNIIPVERRVAWLEKNPEIFYVLRNKSDNYMIGYTSLIPLKPEKIEKILRDEETADIFPDDIEVYEPGKPLHIYVMAVGVRPGVSRLQKREYGFRLINGLVDRFVEMGKQGIIIERLVGRSNKPDGINILQGMGFTEIESPQPSTRVFVLNVEESGAPIIKLYKKALSSYYSGNLT